MLRRDTGTWRLGLGCVAAAALATYLPALPNEFVWDDVPQVEDNPFIRRLENLPAAFVTSYWGATQEPNLGAHWRPLTTASYVVSWAACGSSPAGFRSVNLLLHAAAAVLVALLGAELGLGGIWALLAGLVFAVHPVNVETVAWVVGRAELGATALALLALLLWLRGARSGPPGWTVAGCVALLAGMGFKESAASAVGVAAAIAFVDAPGSPLARLRAAARLAAPLLLPVAAFVGAQRLVFGAVAYQDEAIFAGAAGWQVLLTMAKVVVKYLALLAFPVTLRAHYDLVDTPLPLAVTDPVALAALGLDLGLVALIGFGLLKRRPAALAGAWILAGLLPFLHLVPFQWLMAERFLYLGCAGFALLLGTAGQAASAALPGARSARLAGVAGAAWLALAVVRVELRIADWRDEVTFYSRMVEQEPDLIGARVGLAWALARRGRVDEAAEQFRLAGQLGWKL